MKAKEAENYLKSLKREFTYTDLVEHFNITPSRATGTIYNIYRRGILRITRYNPNTYIYRPPGDKTPDAPKPKSQKTVYLSENDEVFSTAKKLGVFTLQDLVEASTLPKKKVETQFGFLYKNLLIQDFGDRIYTTITRLKPKFNKPKPRKQFKLEDISEEVKAIRRTYGG